MSVLTGQFNMFDPKDRVSIAQQIDATIHKDNFFAPLIGSNSNAVIRTYNADRAGATTIKLRDKLRGQGVKGNSDFDTNRDRLKFLSQTVNVEIFKNSLRGDDTRLHQYKDGFEFAELAAEALTEWGIDEFEAKCYANLANNLTNVACAKADGTLWTAPTTQTVQAYCGQITADDVPTVSSIRAALTRAKLGINQWGKKVPALKPYRTVVNNVNGIDIRQKVYIVILCGFGAAWLKEDPEWKELQKMANERGNNNPVFNGQLGYIDGSIVIDGDVWNEEGPGVLSCNDDPSWQISEAVDYIKFSEMYAGAGSVETSIGLILGATAMVMPMDDGVNLYFKKEDFDTKDAVAFDRLMGLAKAKFVGIKAEEKETIYHNNDYSVMGFIYARKEI